MTRRSAWWLLLAALVVWSPGDVHAQSAELQQAAVPCQEDSEGPDVRCLGAFRASLFATQPIVVQPHDPLRPAVDVRSFEIAGMQANRRTSVIAAAAGFGVGAVATFLWLHQDGSTSYCDRTRNQDAWAARECIGATVLGGAVGVGLGLLSVSLWRAIR